jgi:hypothetical protein
LASKTGRLKGLLELLGGRFQVVIHLDAKVDTAGTELPSGVVLVEPRLSDFWGGFNMVLAIRNMIDAAYTNFSSFRRLVAINGETSPIVSLDELDSRLNIMDLDYVRCEIRS